MEHKLHPCTVWVKGMTDKWKLRFSAVTPIGGGVDYGDDLVGRYQTTEAFFSSLARFGSGGYKLNDDTSLGFGLSAIYQLLELSLAVNQPWTHP